MPARRKSGPTPPSLSEREQELVALQRELARAAKLAGREVDAYYRTLTEELKGVRLALATETRSAKERQAAIVGAEIALAQERGDPVTAVFAVPASAQSN
jgi:hypothetical protein